MNEINPIHDQKKVGNKEQHIYKNSLLRLAEMLKILREGDSKETRQKFKTLCLELAELGRQAKLTKWVKLLEMTAVAIADTNNQYISTAKTIIKEIKQASEYVLHNENEQIEISDELEKLVPDSFLNLISVEEDIEKSNQTNDTINRDLWRNTETLVIEDNLLSEQQIRKNEDLSEANNSDLNDETYVIENYLHEQNADELIDQNLDDQQENDLEEYRHDNYVDDYDSLEMEVDDLETRNPEKLSSIELDDIPEDTLTADNEEEIPDSLKMLSVESQPEDVIQENLWLKQENFVEGNDLFYESLEELEGFIDAEITTTTSVNWQELSNLIDEKVSPVNREINQQKSQAEVPQKIDSKELSDLEQLEQLLAKAQSSTNKQKWPRKPRKTQQQYSPQNHLFEQTMRIPVKQLDNLNNLVGEMVVRRNKLEEDQERLRRFLDSLLGNVQNLSEVGTRMQDLYERSLLEGALLASRERNQARIRQQLLSSPEQETSIQNNDQVPNNQNLGLEELELDRFSGFHLISQDIMELIVRIRESTSDIQFLVDETEQLGRNLRQVTTQIQEEINKSRMVPFAQTADRLPRAVRDISISCNKQIKLKVEGREVLIDKMILEHLWDPIQQLVKNAITHGIEIPSIREKKGKPRSGTITIRAFVQGSQTVISVSDDGAGIDPEKVKQKATENKLITKAQATKIKTQEIYEFLFYPGFSTRDKTDSYAGRGVGLDIVRSKLNQVRGTVTINSSVNKGTTFTIRLPLTLSIGKALCCINGHSSIAFPMDGIEDTKDYTEEDIQLNEQGQKCIPWRNTLLPFYPLSQLLIYNRQTSRSLIYNTNIEDEVISIVILRGGNNLLAIQVDQIIGQEEIVIKQISGPFPRPRGIAGATVRSDGMVMPIADVIELIDIANGNLGKDLVMDMFSATRDEKQTMVEIPIAMEPLVLIIDDSITVREMLSMSFSKAGYRVEQARDGQEAWQKLKSGLPCDIVFCDIEMPRMNGLEFLKNVQEDPSLSEIPVAILSSRGAEKHQQIAGELGASAYLIKPYVEKDLLDTAKKIMAGEVLLANSIKKLKSI